MKTLNIKLIRIDGGTQSRVVINTDAVTEYADAIKAGAEFPPVIVFHDGTDHWLADGFHRFHAHNQIGRASIQAQVKTGTKRDAVLFSLGANDRHGIRSNVSDRRKAVHTMLADLEWSVWSDNAIAKLCGVDHKTVAAHRASDLGNSHDREASILPNGKIEPETRTVQRAGKTYQQDVSNIGKTQAKPTTPTPEAPTLALVQPPEPEYTELDAKNDQISELQASLVVALKGDVSQEDKQQAATYIAELQAEIKMLRATLKAVTFSRDSLMNELAHVKRQCISQQAKLKQLQAV